METTIEAIETTLKALASEYKTRGAFNKADGRTYKMVDGGAFRVVYDAGNYVIKLRRTRSAGDFTLSQIRVSNKEEAQVYEDMKKTAPNLAFFALAPVYLVLDNKHDAIIMPKVSTCVNDEHFNRVNDEDYFGICFGEYVGRFFTKIMRDQYRFIDRVFNDVHDGNVGWDLATQRVWYIDLNFERCDDFSHIEKRASGLVKKITTARKKVA